MELEKVQKCREKKILRAREEQQKARKLAKEERDRIDAINKARRSTRERDEKELDKLQKKLDEIKKKNSKTASVDLNLDGTNLGRLLVKHGKMYNFNLSTKGGDEPEEKDKCGKKNEQVVVDLDIDGKHGPIATLVKKEEEKQRIWMENDEEKIENFETTAEKADALSELVQKIKGSISSSETSAAQIGSE